MAAILRANPSLRRLLAAWLQSCLGTGAGYVALLLLTLRYIHTSWAVPAVLLADFVPAIALGALFGALADRHSRRLLVVVANLLQAAAWGGLAFAHTAAPILALAVLAGVGNALQRPAMRAALPVVAGDARQVAAAWYDTCRWLGITVGPALAAALFAISGLALPLALNGLSFLVAAGAISTLAIERPASSGRHEERPGAGVREGLSIAFAAPAVAAVIACSAAAVISGGLLNVCEPLLARNVLHGSASDYALLVACYGAGMVTGSVLVARRGDAGAPAIIRRYLASLLLSGLGMGASAIVGSVAPATIAFAATGYANALLVVSETQLIQLRVPNAVQGRLFGAKDTLEGAFYLVGLIGAGVLVATAGVRLTLATGAGLYGICTLAGVAALRPLSRRRASDRVLSGIFETDPALVIAATYEATRRFDPAAAAAVLAEVPVEDAQAGLAPVPPPL
ncbi:MAG TPA: MFS transporter [Solirubrobacteraceae bacterium]|nr:MFS transporter [Solirubrobacteraceae bacterium]